MMNEPIDFPGAKQRQIGLAATNGSGKQFETPYE
jgi:hypothetical protein